jgi:hypothetical protein
VHPDYTGVNIKADVRSPAFKITKVYFKVGNVFVRDSAGASGDDANFSFTPGYQTVSVDSDWDTTQAGVSDGVRTVVIYAEDDQGNWNTEQRDFIVDNEVPGVPGVPTGTGLTSTQARLDFGAAPDPVPSGGAPAEYYASRYMYNLFREPSTVVAGTGSWTLETSGTVNAGATPIAAIRNAGPLAATVPTTPFSRYWATVRAGSPRDFNWAQQASTAAPFVSRPEIHSNASQKSQCITNYSKVGSNRYTDYTVTLYVTKPTFPVNLASTTYEFQAKQATGGSTWFTFVPQSGWTATVVGNYIKLDFVYRDYTTAKALWFKAGVNVTPSTLGTGPTGLLYTNAAGTSPIDSDQKTNTSVTGQLIPDGTWSE